MPQSRPLSERFEEKSKRGPGCWTWLGTHDSNGYAKISVNCAMANAHRVAYELYRGVIPEGLEVDHLCRNRGCVNPAHLEAVTKRVNILRGKGQGAEYARRTSCKCGHPYTTENTRVSSGGHRICRECERLRSQKRWTENPEAWRAYDREYRKRRRLEE